MIDIRTFLLRDDAAKERTFFYRKHKKVNITLEPVLQSLPAGVDKTKPAHHTHSDPYTDQVSNEEVLALLQRNIFGLDCKECTEHTPQTYVAWCAVLQGAQVMRVDNRTWY